MKIKNCPFCDDKSHLWVRKCSWAKFTIGCDNPLCFLFIPEDVKLRELHNYAPCYRFKKDAIKAWDTRPSLQSIDETMEEFDKKFFNKQQENLIANEYKMEVLNNQKMEIERLKKLLFSMTKRLNRLRRRRK